ncbi:hypothetical protein Pcinc_007372 [Petrolisthes cinctipes]|uniref:Uncharacterized protein n=1 Tax=Petrolisthes cinctipes TaxID=88211 RepID=A0AAE1GBA1_PETCI|nr:hypothetical protein Pcinc_007372 [Petrolisthes cinctipes]
MSRSVIRIAMVMVMIVVLILNMDCYPLYNLYSLSQTAREGPPENLLPISTPKHLPPSSTLPLSKIYPVRLPNIENGKLPLKRNNKMWAIWEKDDHGSLCREYLVRFSKGLPQVQLMSFLGSGNSWTRYLLEASTGIFTGSVFNDPLIYKTGEIHTQTNSPPHPNFIIMNKSPLFPPFTLVA